MKTLFFKHDIGARNDPKLLRLRMKYGMEGVGIFWSIIEIMYEQGGYVYKSDIPTIAYDLRIDETLLQEILGCELFVDDDDIITSDRVREVIDNISELREKRRKAIKTRWKREKGESKTDTLPEDNLDTNEVQENSQDNTSVIQMNYKCNTEKRREEKRIEENRIEENNIIDTIVSIDSGKSINLEELKSFFNTLIVKNNSLISQIRAIAGQRRTHTLARIREHSKEDFAKALKIAVQSDFMNGKSESGWVASYDWIIKPNNFIKILEGNYNNRENGKQGFRKLTGSDRQEKGKGQSQGNRSGFRPSDEGITDTDYPTTI